MRLVERALDFTLALLLPLLLAALVSLTLVNVALRYALGASLAWAEEAAIVLMILIAWMGVGLLWLRDAHIGIDWLPEKLSPRGRTALLGFIDALAIAAGVGLAVVAQGTVEVYWTLDLLALGVPAAVKYLPVQVGAALLALAAALRLVRRLRDIPA